MRNIEKIIYELNQIKTKIDATDRVVVMKKLNCHNETINRYLRGEVKKEAFGLSLLGLLKSRIANREKALEECSN